MKATGIIRRVDDLGRVVLPKELRRTQDIREGDPLEIFTDGSLIIFRKYDISEDYKALVDRIRTLVSEDKPDKSAEINAKLDEVLALVKERTV